MNKPNVSRNGSIDALRLLLAFFVVTNHTCIFGGKTRDFLDCAVPTFLMISGYFFRASTIEEECALFAKAIKKFTLIFLEFLFMYAAWDIIKYLALGVTSPYDMAALWTCDPMWCPPLWYIQSFLYTNITLWIICKLSQMGKWGFSLHKTSTPLLTCVTVVLWLLLKGPLQCFPLGWHITICFVFYSLGILLRRIPANKIKMPYILLGGGFSIVLIVSCRLLGITEGTGLPVAYHFTTVVFCVFLFMFFVKSNIPSANIFSRYGREYSLCIYMVHWIFIEFYTLGIWGASHFYSKPIVVMTVSVMLSISYVWIKRQIMKSITKQACIPTP